MDTTIGRRGGRGGRGGRGFRRGRGFRGGPWQGFIYDDYPWDYGYPPVIEIVDPDEDERNLKLVLGQEEAELARSCGAEAEAAIRRLGI